MRPWLEVATAMAVAARAAAVAVAMAATAEEVAVAATAEAVAVAATANAIRPWGNAGDLPIRPGRPRGCSCDPWRRGGGVDQRPGGEPPARERAPIGSQRRRRVNGSTGRVVRRQRGSPPATPHTPPPPTAHPIRRLPGVDSPRPPPRPPPLRSPPTLPAATLRSRPLATCPPSEAVAPPAASAARAGGDVRGLLAGAADRGKRRVAATARAWRGTPSPLPLCCSRYPPGRSRGPGRSRYPRRPPSPF